MTDLLGSNPAADASGHRAKTLLERTFSWFQAIYPFLLVWVHGLLLGGPMLLGRDLVIKLVATGLGGIAGTLFCNYLFLRLTAAGYRPDLVGVFLAAGTSLLAAVAFVAHATYYDDTQSAYTGPELFAYFVSIIVMSVLMRAFLASLPKARKAAGN